MTHRLLTSAALVAGLLGLAGCGGGPRLVPVSGVVTLDGKPYKGAVVSFQPIGSKDDDAPGRQSMGVTDEAGRFTLKYDGLEPGAVVGKHAIRIVTEGNYVPGTTSETGSDDYTPPSSLKVDPIPASWNGLSDKTFEVPAGGTDQANFDILTPPKKGGKKDAKK
jgi:hypothetical protein